MFKFITATVVRLLAVLRVASFLSLLFASSVLATACSQDSLVKDGPPPELVDVAATPAPLTGKWTNGSINWEGRTYATIEYRQDRIGCKKRSTTTTDSCGDLQRMPLKMPDANSYERCEMSVKPFSGHGTRGYSYRATAAADQSYNVAWFAGSGSGRGGSMYLRVKLSWVHRDAPVALRLAHCNVPGDGERPYGFSYDTQHSPAYVYYPVQPWDVGKKMH